ncbi:AAA family ATPase [Mycolicibacterium sp. ND9-15]|uniref:AAA family ATPase n=1 Tax=Mycolicibacterium sp. ND9-15 TaxID=3042320 RepID=UPI002DDA160C|nr:AAA family ATPase [Mycolicibacterium sp. ND9-15]WSE55756.1 AAA family ATPase [Mycolicibacterium sp. ND9-15]
MPPESEVAASHGETTTHQPAEADTDITGYSDILDYLNACYGDQTGRAHAAIGRDPHLVDGKYKHRVWQENHSAWPDDAEALARTLAEASHDGDVYVCPYLMWTDKRTPGGAVGRILVHADVDRECDPQKVRDLGGFAVASGTSGHAHVYVPLSESVPAYQHKALERALVAHFGADAKISANDVLRPPGTLSFKPTVFTPGADPAPVTWLIPPNGDRANPHTLASELGVVLTESTVKGRNGEQVTSSAMTTTPAGVPEPVNLDGYPTVQAALALDTGDRSEDTMRVVGACYDAELVLGQTRSVVSRRADLAQRLAERSDDDVLTCWLKVVDDRQNRKWMDSGQTASGPSDDGDSGGGQTKPPTYAGLLLTRSALRTLPNPAPLIDNVLDKGTCALLYGHRGTFKTFIALDWALCGATGRPWQGRATERGRVLYIAAEGAFGAKGRIDAWETGWHTSVSDENFAVLPRPVNLNTPADVANLGALIDWGGYSFVLIDTMARCMVGADENSAKDTGLIVDRLYWLLDRTPGRRGVVLGVHHTGKDAKTLRGSSAFEAGVDTVYSTTRDDGVVILNREKRKDGPEADRHELRLDLIEGSGSGTLSAVNLSTWGVERPERAERLFATFRHYFSTTGASKSELRKVSDLTDGTFYRALDDLLKCGDLINDGTDKRPFYKAVVK